MYKIQKTFTFSASHQLNGLPADHPCGRLHGHNYVVELVIASDRLDEWGFVVDYNKLDKFKALLDECFDHRHLNDFIEQPTAENIAAWLYKRARQMEPMRWMGWLELTVRVSETPKTWAAYSE